MLTRGVGGGGVWGSYIQNCGITTKRMDQLAPHLAHKCGFIWEWTYAKNNYPLDNIGGGLGGKQWKSLEHLPNGWTDWHRIWYTPAHSMWELT